MTPIDFCASFAPWLSESAADIPHSDALTGAPDASCRTPQSTPEEPDCQVTARQANDGEDRQKDQRPEDPHGMPSVEASPVNRVQAAIGQRGSDEPADECVARARRQPP